MRFVCDSCRAQYQIADEKVGAKGVKVRCKKCGYVILVKPGQEGPPVLMPVPVEGEGTNVGAGPDDAQETQVMQNPLAGPAATLPISGEAPPDVTDPQATALLGGEPPAPSRKDRLLGRLDDDEIGAAFDTALGVGGATNPFNESDPTQAGIAMGFEDDGRMSTRVVDADVIKRLAQAESAPAPATPVKVEPPPSVDPAVALAKIDWFVAIGEEQTGPHSLEKVKKFWEQGEIGPDSLCWRDGLEDWKPLSEVSELAAYLAPKPAKPLIVSAASSGPAPAVPTPAPDSVFASIPDSPNSLGGSPQESTGVWRPAAASALASLVKEEMDVMKNGPKKAPESVVGFDGGLGGLLDVPVPTGEVPQPQGARGAGAAGAMASNMSRAGEAPAGVGPAFPAAPMSYVQAAPAGRNPMMVALIGLVGLLIVVLGGVAVWALTRGSPPAPPPAMVAQAPAAMPTAAPTAPQAPVAPAPAAPTVAPAEATPEKPAAVAAAPVPEAAPKPTAAPPQKRGTDSNSGSSKGAGPKRPSGEVVAAAPVPESKPSRTSGDDDFESAFGGGGSKPAKAEPVVEKSAKKSVYVPPAPGGGGDAAVKDSLANSDVSEVVLANIAQLKTCAAEQLKREPGSSGRIVMKWRVLTNGKTANIQVAPESEALKGSYMAGCLGSMIKAWQFPRTKTEGEPVRFPFKF